MKNYNSRILRVKILFFKMLAIAILTVTLMLLWNWLMPVIFGLTVLTFWQSLGLLILAKILFGRGYSPNLRRDKSNIQKEQFINHFRSRRSNSSNNQKSKITDEKE